MKIPAQTLKSSRFSTKARIVTMLMAKVSAGAFVKPVHEIHHPWLRLHCERYNGHQSIK